VPTALFSPLLLPIIPNRYRFRLFPTEQSAPPFAFVTQCNFLAKQQERSFSDATNGEYLATSAIPTGKLLLPIRSLAAGSFPFSIPRILPH
jgi:hypothetical protein